jgi:hypothetical protein
MPSLRFREYDEAMNFARQRAQSERNPYAKQILQEIERSYHRLVVFEKWAMDQQRCNRPSSRADGPRSKKLHRQNSPMRKSPAPGGAFAK